MIAIGAVMDFINREKGLEEIIFVSFSKSDYMLYKGILDKMIKQ